MVPLDVGYGLEEGVVGCHAVVIVGRRDVELVPGWNRPRGGFRLKGWGIGDWWWPKELGPWELVPRGGGNGGRR